FTVLAFVVIAQTFGKEPAPTVTFVSPCECIAFHGVNRWVAKTDLSPVPSDKSAIQAIIPSQIYAWEGLGPDVDMTDYTAVHQRLFPRARARARTVTANCRRP